MEKRSVYARWDEIRREARDRIKEKVGDGKDALDCGDEIDTCLTKLTGLLGLMEVCREEDRDAIDWNAVARVMGDYVEHIKESADRSWELYIGCRDLAEDLLAQIKGEASPDPVRATREASKEQDS